MSANSLFSIHYTFPNPILNIEVIGNLDLGNALDVILRLEYQTSFQIILLTSRYTRGYLSACIKIRNEKSIC